jgi:DNA-binding transcriptional LysR family regulator
MKQYAKGERGTLRIGMECHPCYQWLLKVVSPYLSRWPDVDVDVKQRFLGIRDADAAIDYLAAFVALARESASSAPHMLR